MGSSRNATDGTTSSITLNALTTMAAARARWAVSVVFAANGATIGSLAVRTPSLKLEHTLTDGRLGLVSALLGVAAVISMQLTGPWAARLGSSWIVRAATLGLPLALLGVGLSRGFAQLTAAMILFGALHGMCDVTMNAHAVAVERSLRRPILNGCHAAWSLGAVAGSLAGGAAAQAGVPLGRHYLGLAAVLVPVALIVGRWLLPPSADRTGDVDRAARTVDAGAENVDQPRVDGAGLAARLPGRRSGWTRRLLILGAIGATVLTCEAAVANWSGVLLHEHLGASLGMASLGYIVFIGGETAGRLVGDRFAARRSARSLVRTGTAVGAAGLTVAVLSPWPALSIAGFAVMGLGLSTPLPVLFSVVGHLGAGGPGAAVLLARFATMTYSGILLGPAIIGWLAEWIGLTWTLTALIPLLLGVAGYGAAATDGEREAAEPATPR